MLSFNPTFKVSELREKINAGYFDGSIKKYLLELQEEGALSKYNPVELFDVTIEYDNGDGCLYLHPGASQRDLDILKPNEKDLLDLFIQRINSIYANLDINNLEYRLDRKIKSLYEILEKYNELNKKTHNRFDWRSRAIEAQIEVLEELRDNQENGDWLECYKEDLAESKED
jgi:hypothetical protein